MFGCKYEIIDLQSSANGGTFLLTPELGKYEVIAVCYLVSIY